LGQAVPPAATPRKYRHPHVLGLLRDDEQIAIKELNYQRQKTWHAERFQTAQQLRQGRGARQHHHRGGGKAALHHQRRRARGLAGKCAECGERDNEGQDRCRPRRDS
jgi:hypothetical protein